MSQQKQRSKLPPIPRTHVGAIQYWQGKLKDNFENPRVHRNLAPLLMERAERGQRGCALQAMKHLKTGSQLDPTSAILCNDFGLALLNAGRTDRAIAEFLRGLKNDPNSAIIRKNLAAAYARKGRFKDALEHAHEAARLDPNDPQAHRNIAKILDVVGNTRDALEHNRIALKLGPACQTGGVIRDKYDTDTHRIVARQSVARHEYADGRGFTEEHYDAYRALSNKRVAMPFSEVTKELLQKAGIN